MHTARPLHPVILCFHSGPNFCTIFDLRQPENVDFTVFVRCSSSEQEDSVGFHYVKLFHLQGLVEYLSVGAAI